MRNIENIQKKNFFNLKNYCWPFTKNVEPHLISSAFGLACSGAAPPPAAPPLFRAKRETSFAYFLRARFSRPSGEQDMGDIVYNPLQSFLIGSLIEIQYCCPSIMTSIGVSEITFPR